MGTSARQRVGKGPTVSGGRVTCPSTGLPSRPAPRLGETVRGGAQRPRGGPSASAPGMLGIPGAGAAVPSGRLPRSPHLRSRSPSPAPALDPAAAGDLTDALGEFDAVLADFASPFHERHFHYEEHLERMKRRSSASVSDSSGFSDSDSKCGPTRGRSQDPAHRGALWAGVSVWGSVLRGLGAPLRTP